jgi:predicted regulator of Ras-like GTPase activity (Roadblock/LC7/MglB family)
MSTRFRQALDNITRVRGVWGAMLVAGDDGLIIAETLMEGVRGDAVAALAASLAKRMRRVLEAAAVGMPHFAHLQGVRGTLVIVPAPDGVLVVAVGAPDMNVGLVRLEMLRAAETVA